MTNKQLVTEFYNEVFKKGDLSNIDKFMKDDYIQHSPEVYDHKEGFIQFIKGFLSMGPKIEILNISEDQNMVYVFFKCTLKNGHVNKVCDIYRIENNRLAEHWDVIEHNVENVKAKSGNGIF